jgi:hypothetical protein
MLVPLPRAAKPHQETQDREPRPHGTRLRVSRFLVKNLAVFGRSNTAR